ncbi:MAG: hypothetical protein ACUVSC_03825, partial [Candidatus Fervidibacter sp.]
IELVNVGIKRLNFPEQSKEAVFARMRAERERMARRYIAEGEEIATKIRAEADREKERILASAYKEAERIKEVTQLQREFTIKHYPATQSFTKYCGLWRLTKSN